MLTGAKDAYTPMEDAEPKIEVEAEGADSGTATPVVETDDAHSRAQTPLFGTESSDTKPSRIYRHGPDDLQVETERLSKLALSVERTNRVESSGLNPIEPLSTRFRTPGPQMGTLPRTEFATQQTPTLAQDGTETAPESAIGNPYRTPHEELGLPPMPLFRIDQLGVDRRMVRRRRSSGQAAGRKLNLPSFIARQPETTVEDVPVSRTFAPTSVGRWLTSILTFYRIWMQVKARKLV